MELTNRAASSIWALKWERPNWDGPSVSVEKGFEPLSNCGGPDSNRPDLDHNKVGDIVARPASTVAVERNLPLQLVLGADATSDAAGQAAARWTLGLPPASESTTEFVPVSSRGWRKFSLGVVKVEESVKIRKKELVSCLSILTEEQTVEYALHKIYEKSSERESIPSGGSDRMRPETDRFRWD